MTRLVDALMAEGMYDIFEMSREKIAVTLKERNTAKFVFKVRAMGIKARVCESETVPTNFIIAVLFFF